jgi:hypothetical protein
MDSTSASYPGTLGQHLKLGQDCYFYQLDIHYSLILTKNRNKYIINKYISPFKKKTLFSYDVLSTVKIPKPQNNINTFLMT